MKKVLWCFCFLYSVILMGGENSVYAEQTISNADRLQNEINNLKNNPVKEVTISLKEIFPNEEKIDIDKTRY